MSTTVHSIQWGTSEMASDASTSTELADDSLLVMGENRSGQIPLGTREHGSPVLQRPEYEMVVWIRGAEGGDYRRLPTLKGDAIQLHVGSTRSLPDASSVQTWKSSIHIKEDLHNMSKRHRINIEGYGMGGRGTDRPIQTPDHPRNPLHEGLHRTVSRHPVSPFFWNNPDNYVESQPPNDGYISDSPRTYSPTEQLWHNATDLNKPIDWKFLDDLCPKPARIARDCASLHDYTGQTSPNEHYREFPVGDRGNMRGPHGYCDIDLKVVGSCLTEGCLDDWDFNDCLGLFESIN